MCWLNWFSYAVYVLLRPNLNLSDTSAGLCISMSKLLRVVNSYSEWQIANTLVACFLVLVLQYQVQQVYRGITMVASLKTWNQQLLWGPMLALWNIRPAHCNEVSHIVSSFSHMMCDKSMLIHVSCLHLRNLKETPDVHPMTDWPPRFVGCPIYKWVNQLWPFTSVHYL